MYNYFRIHQDYACSMLDTEKIQDFSKSLANYTSLNREHYGGIRVNNSLHSANV